MLLLPPVPGFKSKLQNLPGWMFVSYVSLSSFIVYTCMYGFRKPYTSSAFEGIFFLGLSYKVVLVVAQVVGYMLGKFYGIRFIAMMNPRKRAITIIKLIFTAWASLFLFAIVPPPFNIVFMLINGFPLAMVWGLVFGYLEGRRVTELMGAILATSFIFASGVAKTVGKWVMIDFGITQWWMPFIAGSLFIVPLLVSTWLLNQTPPPTVADEKMRTIRKPMDKQERLAFIHRFGLALIPVIIAYGMLTVLRDFCEDFSNELWIETGYAKDAGIFAKTSTLTSLIVLAIIGGFFIIKNNYKAFQLNNVIIIFGFLLAATSTYVFHRHLISPVIWIVGASTGLYLGYLPYNCFYFERLLAAFKVAGNVGFVIYIADAFGYLSTLLVLIGKGIGNSIQTHTHSWVEFFTSLFYISAAAGILLVIVGSSLFARIYRRANT